MSRMPWIKGCVGARGGVIERPTTLWWVGEGVGSKLKNRFSSFVHSWSPGSGLLLRLLLCPEIVSSSLETCFALF